MLRKIKFRAWEKIEKFMVDGDSFTLNQKIFEPMTYGKWWEIVTRVYDKCFYEMAEMMLAERAKRGVK